MMITTKEENGKLIVTLQDRLNTNTAPVFQKEVEPLLENCSHMLLDFEKVDYVSSAGLRVLLYIEQTMEGKNGILQLCHVSDIVRDSFDITGFLDILTLI